MLLRPLRPDPADLAAARRVTAVAYAALPGAPAGPADWSAPRVTDFERRLAHVVLHDGPGCWVAEHDGEVVGVACGLRREGLWVLSLLAVAPTAQDAGVGKALLERAATHAGAALRGMIASSPDPRAVRRYRAAGFRVHPTMRFTGEVHRAGLPAPSRLLPVRLGGGHDVDLADSVDRRVRGAGHGVDHEALAAGGAALLVCDTFAGQGYAWQAGGRPRVLAATSKRVAVSLLWTCLAQAAEGTRIDQWRVTAEQEWALDVALAAGLAVTNEGFLCLRGMRPPAPYLPDGFFG